MLGRLIDKAKDCNALRGSIVGRDKVEVSHLQFADDALFFMEAYRNYFFDLFEAIRCFLFNFRVASQFEKEYFIGH